MSQSKPPPKGFSLIVEKPDGRKYKVRMNNQAFNTIQQALDSGKPTSINFNCGSNVSDKQPTRPNSFFILNQNIVLLAQTSTTNSSGSLTLSAPVEPKRIDSNLNRPAIHGGTRLCLLAPSGNGLVPVQLANGPSCSNTPIQSSIATGTAYTVCSHCAKSNPNYMTVCPQCKRSTRSSADRFYGSPANRFKSELKVSQSASIPRNAGSTVTAVGQRVIPLAELGLPGGALALVNNSPKTIVVKAAGLPSAKALGRRTSQRKTDKVAPETITLSSDEESETEENGNSLQEEHMNLANKLESNEIATPSVEKDVEYSVNRPHCHNLELELMTEWEVPLSDRYVRLSNSSTQQSPEPKICGNKSPKSVKEVFNPITSPGMCHLLDSYSEATDSQGRSGSACSTVASVAEAPSIILKFRAIRFGTYNNLKPEALTLTQDNVVANLPVTTDAGEKTAVIQISYRHIRQIAYSFTSSGINVIFLRVSPNGGSKIRGCLNLPDNVEPSDTETPFFDPDSQNGYHRLITVVLNEVSPSEIRRFEEMLRTANDRRRAKAFSRGASASGFEVVKMEFSEAKKLLSSVVPSHLKGGTNRNAIPPPSNGLRTMLETNGVMSPISASSADSASISSVFTPTSNQTNGNSLLPSSTVAPVSNKRPLNSKTPRVLFPYKQGISVAQNDLACLEEGEFLNDVIIDFYLRYSVDHFVPDDRKEKIHVFSSFFWRGLNSKKALPNSASEPALSNQVNPIQTLNQVKAKARHRNVKSWTKNVDLFTKDFIIVPINESAHWFLAIICFPYLDAAEYEGDRTNESENSSVELNQSADSESTGQSMEVVTDPSEKDELSQGGTGPSVIPETPPSSTTAPASGASFIGPRLPDDLDPQEAQDYDDEMEQNKMMEKSGDDTSSETASVTGGKKTRVKKRPCIIIFDSLGSAACTHATTVRVLREYLSVEWAEKRGAQRVLDGKTLRGVYAKVPLQDNYSDCGLYVLQYAESFFKDIPKYFEIPLNLENWFSQEEIKRKRADLKDLISRLTTEHHKNKPAKRPKLESPAVNPKSTV